MSGDLDTFGRETAPDAVTVARIRKRLLAPRPEAARVAALAVSAAAASALLLGALLASGAEPAVPVTGDPGGLAIARPGLELPVALQVVGHPPARLAFVDNPHGTP